MNFEEERKKLYNEFFYIENKNEVTQEIKGEFWKLIEQCIISLYEGENTFFGQFLIQVKRDIRLDIEWPIATKVSNGEFVMYFNPILVLECELKEIQALLKHEVYHIMMGHYERAATLKNKYSKYAISIAMDIAINQYIKNLPSYSKRLENVNFEFNLDLKQDMVMEQYAKELQESINKRGKKADIIKDNKNFMLVKEISQENSHEIWNEADSSLENLKEITKKIAINSYKGKAPKDLEKIIIAMKEKAEINWSEFLKRLIPSTKSGYRKTITRKDRRMPERLELRGKLPNSIPKIIIAIDISASMTDKEINTVIIEILDIVKSKRAEIKVIECDDEIRRIYNLNSVKDIKARSKKNGSTKFSPVFKYIKDNKLRDYILIYFTDGVGEKELLVKPINYKTIWVLTGDEELSLIKPHGVIKRIAKEVKENYGKDYGLKEIRESIHDWAR